MLAVIRKLELRVIRIEEGNEPMFQLHVPNNENEFNSLLPQNFFPFTVVLHG